MSVKTMRRKVSFSFLLLIFSLALFVFSTYAYFTNSFSEAFSGEMGIVDVSLDAYFETVTQSTNLDTSNDVSFDTNTITSINIDLSVYSIGVTIRVNNSTSNDGYYTVVSSTVNSLVVVESLTTEAVGALVIIDEVTVVNLNANEVVIESANQYIGTDIAFNSVTKNITSSTTDLSVYSDGDTLRIAGSTSNDGHYTVSGIPSSTSLFVIENIITESSGSSITIDEVITTKPGVYYVNIVSAGNTSFFEDFRLIVNVYSSLDTYIRVKIYEQLTLTYTDYQGDVTELSILFDGYMPFKYNTTNWYDNRTNDNYMYYKVPVQRINDVTPTELPLISSYFSGQNYETSPPGYSLQIAFSIEAVQVDGGPEGVWGLTTKPWDGLSW